MIFSVKLTLMVNFITLQRRHSAVAFNDVVEVITSTGERGVPIYFGHGTT